MMARLIYFSALISITLLDKCISEQTFVCPEKDGVFANPANIRSYYLCSNGSSKLFNCCPNLVFDPTFGVCHIDDAFIMKKFILYQERFFKLFNRAKVMIENLNAADVKLVDAGLYEQANEIQSARIALEAVIQELNSSATNSDEKLIRIDGKIEAYEVLIGRIIRRRLTEIPNISYDNLRQSIKDMDLYINGSINIFKAANQTAYADILINNMQRLNVPQFLFEKMQNVTENDTKALYGIRNIFVQIKDYFVADIEKFLIGSAIN